MGRRARVERTREQKWEIVLEGIRRRNIAQMCRECEISPTAYYRWKNEARERATTAPDAAKDRLIRQMERALEKKAVEAEILRKLVGRSCGELHSQARKLVEQGYEPNVVATALSISRSSLYYRNRPRCKVKKAEDPDYRETLLSTLHCPPAQYGINRTTWTTSSSARLWPQKAIGLVTILCRRLSKIPDTDSGRRGKF